MAAADRGPLAAAHRDAARPPRIAFERATRWPGGAALPLSVAGAMLAGVAVLARWAPELRVCNLRRLAGVPCPACGSTRAVLALLEGDVATAFASNPLVLAAGVLAALLLALRATAGRVVVVRLGPRGRAVAWGLAALAVLADWIHVAQAAR